MPHEDGCDLPELANELPSSMVSTAEIGSSYHHHQVHADFPNQEISGKQPKYLHVE